MEIKSTFHNVLSSLVERLQSIVREDVGRYLFDKAVTDDIISFAKSLLEYRISNRQMMNSAELVRDFCILQLSAEKDETFLLIYLDAKLKLLGFEKLFVGSLTYTNIYPRKIIARVLEYNACAVVLSHNHPSGDVKPSQDDVKLTESLQSLLKIVEVRMVDHIIVGGGKSCSMAEKGLV